MFSDVFRGKRKGVLGTNGLRLNFFVPDKKGVPNLFYNSVCYAVRYALTQRSRACG